MLYYYFTPDLDHLGTDMKTILVIIDENHKSKYTALHMGAQKIANVIGVLKGNKKNAILNLHNEDNTIRNLASIRIKHGEPIYNAYEHFHTIKGASKHFLNLL